MSKILVNKLRVRSKPSKNSEIIAEYNAGDIIHSGDLLIKNEDIIWLRYTGSSGNRRYVCVYDKDGTPYVDVPPYIPGPNPQIIIDCPPPYTEYGWSVKGFCSCKKCDEKSNGITESGYQLKSSDHFLICAAPQNIPFHTRIQILGRWNGSVTVEDRLYRIDKRKNLLFNKILYIYCKSHEEMIEFGEKKDCEVLIFFTSGRPPTGIFGIPLQNQFDDSRIQKWGCCFLCTCVKGGLTTAAQCMDCFNWGIQSGKLRSSDCFMNCNKEKWAVEISQRYGTPYHGDFIFQKNNHHFWLTQNGREIFNSSGLGWR